MISAWQIMRKPTPVVHVWLPGPVRNLSSLRLNGCSPASEAAGHSDRHCPVDEGFVVPGQAFVLSRGRGYPDLTPFCMVRDSLELGGGSGYSQAVEEGHDGGVAEFLDLGRLKPNSKGLSA
jgi:hypothetical protein